MAPNLQSQALVAGLIWVWVNIECLARYMSGLGLGDSPRNHRQRIVGEIRLMVLGLGDPQVLNNIFRFRRVWQRIGILLMSSTFYRNPRLVSSISFLVFS